MKAIETLDYKEVAALLKISVGSLRNRIWAGRPVPPYVEVGCSLRRFWLREDVEAWLKANRVVDPKVRNHHSKKLGRPTKAAQVAARLRQMR